LEIYIFVGVGDVGDTFGRRAALTSRWQPWRSREPYRFTSVRWNDI